MAKKVSIPIIIILICLLGWWGFSVYNNNTQKDFINRANVQLETQLTPYINNTSFMINDDTLYKIQLNNVQINGDVYEYKKTGNVTLHVDYSIYENEIEPYNLLNDKSFSLAVIRDAQSGNIMAQNHNNVIIQQGIFEGISSQIEDAYLKSLSDDFDVNSKVEVIKGSGFNSSEVVIGGDFSVKEPGYCYSEYTTYGDKYSLKVSSRYYLEDMKKEMVIPVKFDTVMGEYSPLWDIEEENAKNIGYLMHDSNYNIENIDKAGLLSFLKELPFEIGDEDLSIDIRDSEIDDVSVNIEDANNEDEINCDLNDINDTCNPDSQEVSSAKGEDDKPKDMTIRIDINHTRPDSILIRDNKLYYPRADAICEGEEYVEELKDLLGITKIIKQKVVNSTSLDVLKEEEISDIPEFKVFKNSQDVIDFYSKYVDEGLIVNDLDVNFDKEVLLVYNKVINKRGKVKVISGVDIDFHKNEVDVMSSNLEMEFFDIERKNIELDVNDDENENDGIVQRYTSKEKYYLVLSTMKINKEFVNEDTLFTILSKE